MQILLELLPICIHFLACTISVIGNNRELGDVLAMLGSDTSTVIYSAVRSPLLSPLLYSVLYFKFRQYGICILWNTMRLPVLVGAVQVCALFHWRPLTDASPVPNFGHSAERSWQGDSNLSAEARADGCVDLAAQFVDIGQHVDVRFFYINTLYLIILLQQKTRWTSSRHSNLLYKVFYCRSLSLEDLLILTPPSVTTRETS